ncbi:MAG TPA: nucleoside-diphosphate kinase [Candidatus Saccharimonadales bacterium]|nr:nucleoside-diphosphate kinase [Candidatus Saccharimonadales bacterium]
METSLYMIKPEAMVHQEEIRTLISAHLTLGERKTVVLPEWVMQEFYADLSADLQRATCMAFNAGPVELGLVHGHDAINVLKWLSGDKTSPQDCRPGSIRYRFGVKEPVVVGGARYFLNAIHRPMDEAEAVAHIKIFNML